MRKTKKQKGITLIALVITIIIIIILSAVSINLILGDSGILKRTKDAGTKNNEATAKERIQMEVVSSAANENSKIDKNSLILNLEKIGANVEEETANSEDFLLAVTLDGYTFEVDNKGNLTEDDKTIEKLGDAYRPTWIGKKITYSAGPTDNIVNDWIIIGQDPITKDVLITTANPVGGFNVEYKMTAWCDYLDNLNNLCSKYAGTIGANNTYVKKARSITIDDVNNAVGFNKPEKATEYIFGPTDNLANNKVTYYYPDEKNKTWVNPVTSNTEWKCYNDGYYYYEDGGAYSYESEENCFDAVTLTSEYLSMPYNMKFIAANGSDYWLGTRGIAVYDNEACFGVGYVSGEHVDNYNYFLAVSDSTGGEDFSSGNKTLAIRPCVVLSSRMSYDDLKDSIGEEYNYNNN